ncbi:outer membrane beta-barrel protein [Mucilaginibacter sp. McL0603]|uniref:outer membrane beta-barrel protein n=1 Tax=Mucilaginibacter sp. McL0603 TaxID=3415670 RepID=UPI003CEF420C
MKIIFRCLIAVLLTCGYVSAFAQTNFSALQGKIFTNGGPADSATVVLLNYPDSSVVKSTISSKAGAFYFDRLSGGKYLIFITKLNYNKSYSGPYELVSGKSMDVGFIQINGSSAQLGGVTIAGKKDFVEVKSDRVVLNVDQNVMSAGASLLDVLSTSPGVKVVNDEVLYHGGQKALIAINGKPVLLSGEELINFLKNYQSSSISRIELIDNPGAKYNAGGSAGGMINIILKKSKDMGSNVSITESAGYGDKYKFNTGVNYTLRTKKLNLFASYNYVNNSITHTINTNRFISNNGQLDNFDLNYNADVKASNNAFNLGADYQLTSQQTIGFLINGFDNVANIDKRNTTRISTNGLLDSSINTVSKIDRNIHNMNYNLNYKVSLDKASKSVLSANADYSDYHRISGESLRNDFFNASVQNENTPVFYFDNSPSHITIKSANIDFSQALSKSSQLDMGVKSSQANSDNQIDFAQLMNGNYVLVPALTDHFIYNERIDAGYIQFNSKFNKTSFTLSLRGEHTHFTAESVNPSRHADSSYFSLFPNAEINQQLDKNNLLTLSYSRNIDRPNYQDLNPFVSYVDEFYSSTGNPFLRPDFVNTYRVSDLFLDKYRGSLSVIVTDNFFYNVFKQNDTTKAYITTKANLGTHYQYVAEFAAPIDITPWWHIDANFTAFIEHYTYKIDSAASKSTSGITLDMTQNFKLTPKLSFQVTGEYLSPSYYAISQYNHLFWLNAGLTYSILNKKGSIKLVASDIFNTFYNQYQTNFANLNIASKDQVGSRFIVATFTYRFGSSSAKGRSKTTDEQKRLGGGGNE